MCDDKRVIWRPENITSYLCAYCRYCVQHAHLRVADGHAPVHGASGVRQSDANYGDKTNKKRGLKRKDIYAIFAWMEIRKCDVSRPKFIRWVLLLYNKISTTFINNVHDYGAFFCVNIV